MSRQTATPPPKPVAALLSPVLWQMEHPDKFDMYRYALPFINYFISIIQSIFLNYSIYFACSFTYVSLVSDAECTA
jgi:hypothetical protein